MDISVSIFWAMRDGLKVDESARAMGVAASIRQQMAQNVLRLRGAFTRRMGSVWAESLRVEE